MELRAAQRMLGQAVEPATVELAAVEPEKEKTAPQSTRRPTNLA
jgi:hypothetical protein